MRIALTISYQGTRYSGWQRQREQVTVQGELERALSSVANEPITVKCAGRTDSGVHAACQVVHFDTKAFRQEEAWLRGVNRYLPEDIAVVAVHMGMPQEFDARFSAEARLYTYVIMPKPVVLPAYVNRLAYHHYPLDVDLMNQAAQHLVGTHDFTSFRGAECQARSPVRTIYSIDVSSFDDKIVINVLGNAFLHHMIRNIVGSLCLCGEKKQLPSWMKFILMQKDRTKAGPMAPACGLYLSRIFYPLEFKMDETLKMAQHDIKLLAPFGRVIPDWKIPERIKNELA